MKKTIITLLVTALAATAIAEEAAKTTAKAEEAKKEESKISLSFFSEIGAGMADVNRGITDDVSSYNILGISYKLNEQESISYNFTFTTSRATLGAEELYRYTGANFDEFQQKAGATDEEREKAISEKALNVNSAQRFTNDMHYVKYSNSKVNLFGERAVSARVYLPTNDMGSLTGRYILRADTAFERKLNEKFTASYSLSPRAHFHTKTDSGQTTLDLIQAAGISQKITEKLSADYSFTLRNVFKNTGKALTLGDLNSDGSYTPSTMEDVADSSINLAYLSTGLSYSLTDNLSVTGYIEQNRSLESTAAYSLFNEDETSYAVQISVSL